MDVEKSSSELLLYFHVYWAYRNIFDENYILLKNLLHFSSIHPFQNYYNVIFPEVESS